MEENKTGSNRTLPTQKSIASLSQSQQFVHTKFNSISLKSNLIAIRADEDRSSPLYLSRSLQIFFLFYLL